MVSRIPGKLVVISGMVKLVHYSIRNSSLVIWLVKILGNL